MEKKTPYKSFFATLLIIALVVIAYRVTPLSSESEDEFEKDNDAEAKYLPEWATRTLAKNDAGKKVTLLLTNPKYIRVKNIITLVRWGVISLKNINVVGIYHENELHSYPRVKKFLEEEQISWISIKKIKCKLSEEEIFRDNECTPVFEELVKSSDGIIFSGGADIPPRLYNEKTSLLTSIEEPYRQFFEISFLYHLVGRGKDAEPVPLLKKYPDYFVLAICMGMQALNVATGGTLYQDIPSEIYGVKNIEDVLSQPPEQIHRNYSSLLYPANNLSPANFHGIRFDKEWDFSKTPPQDDGFVKVLSAHHQAIKNLGAGLKPVAFSLDGKIIEAVKHEKFSNILGIQFHPEYSSLWSPKGKAKRYKGDEEHNFIFQQLQKDKTTQDFHINFWRAFSERLKTSAKRK
ncbi:MAG: hypothetical protein Kow0090_19620 [Myxococcota bacterium]